MGGGGGHTLQPHSLGTGNKCPPSTPNVRVFCLGLGGGTKVFYPPRPDYRRFNIYKPGSHSQPCLCPTASFSFSRVMWVICYHINNLSLLCITVYSRNIIFYVNFFRALTASSGGGGGHVPPRPPLRSGTGSVLVYKIFRLVFIINLVIFNFFI